MNKKYFKIIESNSFLINVEDIDLYFLSHNDRIYMFLFLDKIDDVSNISNLLSNISRKEVRQEIFKTLSIKEPSTSFDIRSFLWDLYLIIIYECDENTCMKPQLVNEIERNRFVARKIILQGNSNSISEDLNKILNGKDNLEAILRETESVFQFEQDSLISDIIQTDDSDIEESIASEVFSNRERTLNTIEEYLVALRSKDYTINEDSRS